MSRRDTLLTTAAWAWIASIIYFPVQLAVASAWDQPFDWKENYTSDLGNTACGMFDGDYVCSPLHG